VRVDDRLSGIFTTILTIFPGDFSSLFPTVAPDENLDSSSARETAITLAEENPT
jgi:hypothetical protein